MGTSFFFRLECLKTNIFAPISRIFGGLRPTFGSGRLLQVLILTTFHYNSLNMKYCVAFASLALLTLGACQNSSPTSNAESILGSTALPQLEVSTVTQSRETANSSLQQLENLGKKIDALPKNIQDQKKDEITTLRNKISGVTNKASHMITELDAVLYTTDEKGQKIVVSEIKPGVVPTGLIQNATGNIESLKGFKPILDKLEQEINALSDGANQ